MGVKISELPRTQSAGHSDNLVINHNGATSRITVEDLMESYLSDAMVYSPVAGEVSTIVAQQGELVGSGYPVVAILDMSDLWVTFNVKETLLPKIKVGTRMTAYVPALDRDVELEVSYIAVQADFATWAATRTQGGFDIRTFAVKARPTGDAGQLRPGMSVLVDWDKID